MRRLFGAGTPIRDTDRVRWRSREVSRIEGLVDERTYWLNACLLFVVLLFAYPLKFLSRMPSRRR
jgi:hypothetical protein